MTTKENPKYNLGDQVFSTGIWIALISLLAGSLKLFDHQGLEIIPSSKIGLAIGATSILISLAIKRNFKFKLDVHNFSIGLLFLFLSNWCAHLYNLVQGPWIRGEIIILSLISAFLLFKFPKTFIKYLPWISALILVYSFLSTSDGRLLHSDDHPTFFYRLSLLKENFPNIPFYSPIWNGGFDARDFFATGALNLFLIASPIIYLFPLEETYNYIILGILFLLVPASSYYAVRVAKGDKASAAIAATIVMSASLLWYRWTLKYGTMGFITTTALLPLALAYAVRILGDKEYISWPKVIFCAILFTLMLLWSPSGIALLPLLVFALLFIKRWITNTKIIFLAILLCVLNLPWISVFWSVSNVSSFLDSENTHKEMLVETASSKQNKAVSYKHKAGEINLKKSLKILRKDSVSANPIILLLALPGIFLIDKRFRLMFGSVYLWLLFLGTVAVPLKPQLELDRMLVILYQVLALPCALSISKLLKDFSEESWLKKALPAFVIGVLLTAVFSTGAVLSNRTLEQYSFAEPIVANMTKAIEENTGDGRVLFSGFILHQFSNGHVAPLPLKTAKPMIASSHVHKLWKYKQVFPKEFIGAGDAGIERYLNIYNVETIIAHEREWREYFYSKPDKYQAVWKQGLFHIFKNKNYSSNYFFKGSGEITSQESNSISLVPNIEEVIIKFNYFPFLQSSSCDISPEVISETVSFIKLSNCTPGKEVKISSISAFKRIGL